MAIYSVLVIRPCASGGIDATIGGPGIPAGGIVYWFDRKDEANSFVENLNLLYADAKQLARWREIRARKRIARFSTHSRPCTAAS
jgi:hypothetical protein